jgi:hypothetical protein
MNRQDFANPLKGRLTNNLTGKYIKRAIADKPNNVKINDRIISISVVFMYL